MTQPNLYNFRGKSCTIAEIIKISGTVKNKWQIMWSLGHGKTIEEALEPKQCYVGKINEHWSVIDIAEGNNGRLYWKVKCNTCGIEAIKSTYRVNLDLLCSNCNATYKFRF